MRPPERPDKRGPLSSVVARTLREGGVVEHPEFIVFKETQASPPPHATINSSTINSSTSTSISATHHCHRHTRTRARRRCPST